MKCKVLFLVESLGGGGAEKVLTTVVTHIDKRKYDVTVCSISGGGVYEKQVSSVVNYKSICGLCESRSIFKRFVYSFKYKLIYNWLPMWMVYLLFIPKGYDVEIAFVEGFATRLLSSSFNRKSKKIAWVHCDLKNQPWPIRTGVFADLNDERQAYQKYNKVVCVSKLAEAVMTGYYGLNNTTVIYNPLDVQDIKCQSMETSSIVVDENVFNIVSVGRLEEIKGYDLLLPIVKRLINAGKNVHLWLIGEGTQKQRLLQLANDLGIANNVTFTGFLKNPYSLMSKMNLFVCSSRAEGFSLVIAEAMILGLPVISSNCAGPRELIGDDEYGKICDTSEEMYQSMLNTIDGFCGFHGCPQMVGLSNSLQRIEHELYS